MSMSEPLFTEERVRELFAKRAALKPFFDTMAQLETRAYDIAVNFRDMKPGETVERVDLKGDEIVVTTRSLFRVYSKEYRFPVVYLSESIGAIALTESARCPLGREA